MDGWFQWELITESDILVNYSGREPHSLYYYLIFLQQRTVGGSIADAKMKSDFSGLFFFFFLKIDVLTFPDRSFEMAEADSPLQTLNSMQANESEAETSRQSE